MRYRFVTGSRHYELVDWAQGAKAGRAIDRSMASGLVRGLLREPDAAGRLRGALVRSEPESLHLALDDSEVRERVEAMVERGEWEVWELPVRRPACTITPGEARDAEPVDDGPTETEDSTPKSGGASTKAEIKEICVWSLEASFDDLGDDEDDVFEGSTLKLKAKVTSGECEEAEAAFVITRNGAEVAREVVDPSSGEVEFEFETPEVDEAEANYDLLARYEVGGKTYASPRAFDVWPKTVVVKSTQRDSGELLAGFKIKVIQEDSEQEVESNADGEATCELEKAAPFEIEAEAPCEIVEWTQSAGRVRTCLGLLHYESEFVSPKPQSDGAALEQFINQKTADHGRDQLGSLVTVHVAAKGDADRAAGEKVGAKGDRIYIDVTFGRESKRQSPGPELRGVEGRKVLAGGKRQTGYVKLGEDGAAADFQVELGLAGGDTCEVKIGTTEACGDAALKFVNWRKVFYQISRPSTLEAPPMTRIAASMSEVFVRYEEYKQKTFEESEEGTPAGSWFDGAMMGLSGRCLNIGDHNKKFFHKKLFEDDKKPLGVHVLLCHKQFDGGKPAHKTRYSFTVNYYDECEFPLESEAWVGGYMSEAGTLKSGRNLFPVALQDGEPSIRKIKWKSLARRGEHKGKRGEIAAEHVSIDYVNRPGEFSIKMPPEALAVMQADENINIRFTVLWSLGEYLGEADGNHGNWQLIANVNADSMNDVMAHELGHTLKQVANRPASGLKRSEHKWRYTGRGHQGAHCAFGADEALFRNRKNDLTGLEDCKCIMYGEINGDSPSSDGKFCEFCAPFFRAQNVKSVQ